MAAVPRELFVPEPSAADAYADRALPIGSRPDDLAAVHGRDDLRAARAQRAERVLDVGTGSGYQAAVLAELAAEVVTVERVPELAEQARAHARARRATSGSRSASATARSACPSGRRSTGSPSPPRRRPCRRRSTTSSRRAAGSSSRSGRRRDQRLELVVRGAAGPGRSRLGAVPLRPARRRRRLRRSPPRTALLGSPRRCSAPPLSSASGALARTRGALGRCAQLVQLAKFCTVGASGYVVNLAVYTLLLRGVGAPLPARGDRLVPRRRDEQLHVEPALDLPAASAATSATRACGSSSSRRSRSPRTSLVLHLLVAASASARCSRRRSRSCS